MTLKHQFPRDIINRRCIIYSMTRTQIQLPDTLYRQAKALAAAREVSLAELVRNGLEYVLRVYAAPDASNLEWKMPETFALGADDPFIDPEWRTKLH